MPTLIKGLTITDVSSVDRGAGEGVKVMLMKRQSKESDMDTITKAMQMPERQMIAFCKTDAISKRELSVLIDDMAQAKRERGESREQAFSKFVTRDPLGRDLSAIHQVAAI
jgi:formate-dependent phosphoribosylglycinamide formyltransferase (GAR transformylase)